MRDKKLYTVQWTQAYTAWPKPEQAPEETIDLTQARLVLARIMAK